MDNQDINNRAIARLYQNWSDMIQYSQDPSSFVSYANATKLLLNNLFEIILELSQKTDELERRLDALQ
jgi:hypothetical protein